MTSKKNNLVIIIQARTDSTRFPRKILSNIKGKTMLWHIIERIKKMDMGTIVIATTRRNIDDEIISIAKTCGIQYYRGKKDDVLDRYLKAALKYKARIIMRITSDCPLIDPQETKKVFTKFLGGNFDYVTTDEKSYPKGLDTECFSINALKRAWQEAKSKSDREHVTQYIYNNPNKFRIGLTQSRIKNSVLHRWTVDYKDDLKFIRKIYSRLYNKKRIFLMQDILNLLKREPDLIKINSKYNLQRK